MRLFTLHSGRPSYRRAIVAVLTSIAALALSLGPVAAQIPPGTPMGAPGGMMGGPPLPPLSANVSPFAMGLQSPRGLHFGPDGNLYVAEAGMGGATSTVGMCPQVANPVGPYTGGKTARISKVSPTGTTSVVATGLPSARDGMGMMSSTIGVADIAFIGTTMYALLEGGGCSHGNSDIANQIIKVNPDGTWTTVADLSAWSHANLTIAPPTDDFEPDGNWYAMTPANGALYAVDPNHGELIKITLDGQISRIADFSGGPWIGPTSILYRNGNFYISNLGEIPITAGNAKVYQVTPDGDVTVMAMGVEAVLGLAFDTQGRLYALQMSTMEMAGPTPGTGNVVRMTAAGNWETVASGLFFPTGMTFGPDGMLYVSNIGFGPPVGQIVRIDVNAPATAVGS